MNIRHPMSVLHSFSIKNSFYGKTDLRLIFMWWYTHVLHTKGLCIFKMWFFSSVQNFLLYIFIFYRHFVEVLMKILSKFWNRGGRGGIIQYLRIGVVNNRTELTHYFVLKILKNELNRILLMLIVKGWKLYN